MTGARWTRIRIRARRDETPEHVLLRLGDGREPLPSYRRPGQYLAVRPPGQERPSYFAIASAPGTADLELLVRRGNRSGDALLAVPDGGEVECSEALGAGFPLEAVDSGEVWIVAQGSGLAPLRPAALALAAPGRDARRLHLLVGARTRDLVPFRDDLARLAAAGAEVVLALSGEAEPDCGEERGWAQAVLARRAPDLSAAVVFVCGSRHMEEAVRLAANKLGAGGRVHTNHGA